MTVSDQPQCDLPRLLIALMTPPDVERVANQLIQSLSDRYHTRTARVAPHITLQAAFRWSRDEMLALEQSLEEWVRGYSPFPIYLSGFGTFGKKVIYIQVKKSDELMTLQANLARHLADTFEIIDPQSKRRSFTPHLTVASRKLTPQIFAQAWHYLQPYSVECQYMADRLTVLRHDGRQWHIQKQLWFAS